MSKTDLKLPKSIDSLETPALLIDKKVLEANIKRMQQLADHHGLNLRPHIKTHKSPKLANMQMEKGAKGIAVATLKEAEAMLDAGITDIQLANELATPQQIAHYFQLLQRADISVAVDHPEQIIHIQNKAYEQNLVAPIFLEINMGLNRAGVSTIAKAIDLGKMIAQQSHLKLRGIMTHAGQAYGAKDHEEIIEIGQKEGNTLVSMAKAMRREGFEVPVVSVGSTPTAPFSAPINGITELRVGNYIVNDGIQVALGVVEEDHCALTVMTTVISTPTTNRAITDSGSKSLTSDQGAHGNTAVKGYGKLIGKSGFLDRLSEEHGVIESIKGHPFTIGEKLKVRPNHACPVFNLFNQAYLVEEEVIVEELPILGKR